MHRDNRICVIVPAFNEERKIGRVVERMDFRVVDTVLVVDDGSTDDTAVEATRKGAQVISTGRKTGVGAALRLGLQFARRNRFDIAVVVAGNNKDDPSEIPRLLDPICVDGYDFVIGSRFRAGGRYGGDMPFYRRIATRIHPWLMSRFVRKALTESTNGFRAIRLSILDDDRINLQQRWLDSYALEVYLLWKVIKLDYRHLEVPCTKLYPSKSQGYTKMRPVVDWWAILRPIFLLGFGLRS